MIAALIFVPLAGIGAAAGQYRAHAPTWMRVTAPAATQFWHTGQATTIDRCATWVLLLICATAVSATATTRHSRRHTIATHAVIALMFFGTVVALAPGHAVAPRVTALILAALAAAVVFTVLARVRSAIELRTTASDLDPAAERIIATAHQRRRGPDPGHRPERT